jgi:hypothetical protein
MLKIWKVDFIQWKSTIQYYNYLCLMAHVTLNVRVGGKGWIEGQLKDYLVEHK